MSDRIAIVNAGRLEQVGSAHEIYHRPATRFAADFIGQANLLEVRRIGQGENAVRVVAAGGLELTLPRATWPGGAEAALIAVRPEKVHISKTRPAASLPADAVNVFEARIEEKVFQGATDHLVVATPTGTRLSVIVANEGAYGETFHPGDRVYCGLHADDLVVIRE